MRISDWSSDVCSSDLQRGLYAAAGGQPAHADAWGDAAVNLSVDGFYTNTRATLDRAWLRPRHDGYMVFQPAASERLNTALRAAEGAVSALAALKIGRASCREGVCTYV